MPCEDCNDQGYKKTKNQEGFEEYVICSCHKSIIDKRILIHKLNESNIPKHFWEYELNWYKNKFNEMTPCSDRDKLISYIETPTLLSTSKQSLWICSNDNSNKKSYKTSLAIQLGKSLLANTSHKVKFFPFRKLMDLFLDFDNKDRRAIIQSYLNLNFMIIDDMFDLSRATVKEYQAITLYGFIEDAINNNIQFICTSNSLIQSFNTDKYFSNSASLLQYESSRYILKGE